MPLEVLRLIPTSYREWQLLRLTCMLLRDLLGNYHVIRGITMYIGHKITPYHVLISMLVRHMSDPRVQYRSYARIVMHTGERIVWTHEWGSVTNMRIYRGEEVSAIIIATNYKPDANITIGKQGYSTEGPWEQYIYGELPELASCIRLTCRLTARHASHR